MAPVPARHAALIWSLPALAALLSLLWYRRRRARRRSDSSRCSDATTRLQEPLDAGGGKGAIVEPPQVATKDEEREQTIVANADFRRVWEEVSADLLRSLAEDARSSPSEGDPPAPRPSEEIEGSPADAASEAPLASKDSDEEPPGRVGDSTPRGLEEESAPEHLFTVECGDRRESNTCAHSEGREPTPLCAPEIPFDREVAGCVSEQSAVEATESEKQCVEEGGEESEIPSLSSNLVDGEKQEVEEECFSKAIDPVTEVSISQSRSPSDEAEEIKLDESSSGFAEENNTSSSVSTPSELEETYDIVEESGHSPENIPQITEEKEEKTENGEETCTERNEESSKDSATEVVNINKTEETDVVVASSSLLNIVESDRVEETKTNVFVEEKETVVIEDVSSPIAPTDTDNEVFLEETNHRHALLVDVQPRAEEAEEEEEEEEEETGPAERAEAPQESSVGERSETGQILSPITQAVSAEQASAEPKPSQETVSSIEQNKDDARGKKKNKKKGKSKDNRSDSTEQRPSRETSVGEDRRKDRKSPESSAEENVSKTASSIEVLNREDTVEKSSRSPRRDANRQSKELEKVEAREETKSVEKIVIVESSHSPSRTGDPVQNSEESEKKKRKKSKNQSDSASQENNVDTKKSKNQNNQENNVDTKKSKNQNNQENNVGTKKSKNQNNRVLEGSNKENKGKGKPRKVASEEREVGLAEETKETKKTKIQDCSVAEEETKERCKKVETSQNIADNAEENKEVKRKKKNKKKNQNCSGSEREAKENSEGVESSEKREVPSRGASEEASESPSRNSCSSGESGHVIAEVEASPSQGLGGQRTPEVRDSQIGCEASAGVPVADLSVSEEGTSQTTREEAMEVDGGRGVEEGLAAAVEAVAPALGALRVDTGDSETTPTPPGPAKEGRDSANHSPAEGMLGSPRLCYSDVPSEDSSDSGKGCSDVPTPPSRTPASGSSVAGDPGDPQVYEFVLPQHLVGRLIGRHGCFVQQIKARTNASILIKRHPETARLKVCAVEGAPLDVEAALDMIRAKFPAKRYPAVSLEQVRFVAPSPLVPVLPDSLRLQLVEGISNDVIVSSLVSPAHFFLQQPTHPTFPALTRLCQCMDATYAAADAPPVPAVQAGIVVAAPVMGSWYRAEVVSVDTDADTCQVRYVDYGGYDTQENTALRQIRSDFMTLPFQAAECYLITVCPSSEDGWSPEALTLVEQLTSGQVVQAQVCGYCEDGLPAVCLYAIFGTQVVPIHQELVARGMAVWWEPAEA